MPDYSCHRPPAITSMRAICNSGPWSGIGPAGIGYPSGGGASSRRTIIWWANRCPKRFCLGIGLKNPPHSGFAEISRDLPRFGDIWRDAHLGKSRFHLGKSRVHLASISEKQKLGKKKAEMSQQRAGPVAQIGNLPYRRLVIGAVVEALFFIFLKFLTVTHRYSALLSDTPD